MKRKTLILTFFLLAAGLGATQTYTERPVEGSISSTNDVDTAPYNAGEITVETEGVLPPTDETVKINSRGTEGNIYDLAEPGTRYGPGCDGAKVKGHDIGSGGSEEDQACRVYGEGEPVEAESPIGGGTYTYAPRLEWRPGAYEVEYNVTLRAKGDRIETPADGSMRTLYARPEFDIVVDEDHKFPQREEWGTGYYDRWAPWDGNDFPPDGTLEGHGAQASEYEHFVTGHSVRSNNYVEDAAPGEQYNDWVSETFSDTLYVNVGIQPLCNVENAELGWEYCESRNGSAMERIYYRPEYDAEAVDNEDYGQAVAEIEIDKFKATYIHPNANTHLDINGEIFTAKTEKNNVEFSREVSSDNTGKWINTSKTINLNFEGPTNNEYDDVQKVAVSGEYFTDSPPGVTPEKYRWKNRETGDVLVSYGSLDSSNQGYRTFSQEFKNRDVNLKSGKYTLQIKSTANSYPVTFKQRDFKVKLDTYLSRGDSETFRPQMDLGTNTISFFTTESNSLSYEVEWEECLESDIIGGMSPSDGAFVDSTSPELQVTTGCPSIDNVSIRDARTDTVLGMYEDVAEGTTLTAETDLSIGDTYRWYVRFCDQGVCYETDVQEFTVGQSSEGGMDLDSEELGGKGLPQVIRDEDYNRLGENSPQTPYSEGYINKVEEYSDQLQPGMDTPWFGMNETGDPISVSKWRDSIGTEERADQYAITAKRSWAISNEGNPYPPYGTYYRNPSDRRSVNAPSARKKEKVFANSLAVVAQQDINVDGELIAKEGDGIWMDPDELEAWSDNGWYSTPTGSQWYDVMGYSQKTGDGQRLVGLNMDLTGPDSGLGIDDGSTDGLTQALGHPQIKVGDIYFEGESE